MSTGAMQPPGPKWRVTHQEEEPTIDDNGRSTTVHHVHFRTEHGHDSTVSLPDHVFTAHNVARAIHAKAQEMGAVHTLTSDTETRPPQA